MICDFYKTFYLNQQKGGNLSVYHGATIQRGYGFGSILKSLFRWAVPNVSAAAKSSGRTALKEGVGLCRIHLLFTLFAVWSARPSPSLEGTNPLTKTTLPSWEIIKRITGTSCTSRRAKKAIQLNFEEKNYLEGYMSMFYGAGTLFHETEKQISRENFLRGFILYGFDSSPDLAAGPHVPL
ncbi:predicted protein [Nematostella vectensis]|uniref:Uncharacterized protein n=1 Tax=Nematostella vectensis TaxID=45351 RepID=A7SYG6_NEMVE|nr:predicted protein [Nematostella vectensis]|eukprot:XP_001623352.1 predicted protein [Nematostella vectensis]